MTRIGIMQGRLLPAVEGHFQCFPRDHWAEEFPLAAEAGLQSIEWIYDAYGADANPIATDEGIAEMKAAAETHHVQILSICTITSWIFPSSASKSLNGSNAWPAFFG